MNDFLAYVEKVRPPKFLGYKAQSAEKRLEFETVMRMLGASPAGKTVLDLGPGYGDSLDLCHEQGARAADFVDNDPFFYTYNRLKGLGECHTFNILTNLNRLESGKYDVIWLKGAIRGDAFVEWRPFLNLRRWLNQVERIASASCTIVICPHWRNDGYTREVRDVQHNFFSETMLERGYKVFQNVINHHAEPGYQITFVKEMRHRMVPHRIK